MEIRREACMKIAFLLPHGWRFAQWSLSEVMARYHFSKHLASSLSRLGHNVTLLIVHGDLRVPKVVQTEPFRIEAFPVSMNIPPFQFGGEVSIPLLRRLKHLEVDVLHIHGCFYETLPLL